MIRSLLRASALGLGALGDCFDTANNIPGTIYLLIVGGAVSSVFFPQLVRAMREEPDGIAQVRIEEVASLARVVRTRFAY
jgi:putative peptidoglycan lipid II flippase